MDHFHGVTILNKSPSHYRWFVIGISFIAILFSYMDRNALSFAIRPLEQQFHLNNKDFGLIAAAFGVGYFAFAAIGGFLADHYGSRRIWTLCAFSWSIVCILLGGVESFFALFTLRLLLGVAESPTFPCFVRAATNWLPDIERGRALALGLIAVPLASALGAPVLSLLVTHVGWRGMFVSLGSVTLIWALCWYWQYRDSPADSAHITKSELAYIRKNQHAEANTPLPKFEWRSVLTNPTLMTNNYAFFCFGYLLFFGSAWLPGYLIQTYHIPLDQAGYLLSIPWFTATVLLLIGGHLSDWLLVKTQSYRIARSHLIWICQLLSVVGFLPVIFGHSLGLSILGLSLGIGFGMMPNSIIYAVNADLNPARAGSNLGIMNMGFAASGILSPYLTGFLSFITGSFSIAIMLMMVLTLSSVLAVILFHRPDRYIKKITDIPTALCKTEFLE